MQSTTSYRPNIIYIHSHDTGRFVSPYGYAVRTPNIQKLAEAGVLFRQAYCTSPCSSASSAGLLTGQSAHSSGMLGLAKRGWKLKDSKQHLVHTLKAAGYNSAICGSQQLTVDADGAKSLGYDQEISVENNKARHVAQAAVDWLNDAPVEPFILEIGFAQTGIQESKFGGSIFSCTQGDARYAIPVPTMPDTPRTRQDMADFGEAIRLVDKGIGDILKVLDEAGFTENTLIIYTTDQGLPLPGMKGTLTDMGTGVSLIMSGPGPFGGGAVCDALISQIDIFPTLCEWLNIAAPAHLEGESFLPVLEGDATETNEQIFFELTHHNAYEPMRAVRTKRWKYIRQFEARGFPVLPNVDNSPSKDVWVENGWRERKVEIEQLFDLTFDPHEAHNVAAEIEYSHVLGELRSRLKGWMRATNDPLLEGPVEVPPGTEIVDPDEE